MRAWDRRGRHVSGAEGIYATEAEAQAAAGEYLARAMGHSRGRAEGTSLSVERLRIKPRPVASLPVATLDCESPARARRAAGRLLAALGVSEAALRAAFSVLGSRRSMRGAALIDALTGERLDPDPARGVRATLLGIDPAALGVLRRSLARREIDSERVREALVLASKVALAPGAIAELCASDNPDYTTGYVASRKIGYVRLGNIKRAGSAMGGRVIFLRPLADAGAAIGFLEETPVIVTRAGAVGGVALLEDLMPRPGRALRPRTSGQGR